MTINKPDAPALPDELAGALRRMRLPYLRTAAPDVLATARAQRWDPAEVLRVLLDEEIRGRDAATQRTRRKAAGLPAGKTFDSWRQDNSSIPAATQHACAPSNGLNRMHSNLCACLLLTCRRSTVRCLALAWIRTRSRTVTSESADSLASDGISLIPFRLWR